MLYPVKINRNPSLSWIIAAIILMAQACTLDDPGNTSSSPALTLHADQNLSLITLSWDPVNVTGFKEYILLQSTSDIPNGPEPEINSETIVLKRIDDRFTHSITVSNTLFAPRLCFKLYTAVDDRFLYSQTVCVDQEFTLFNGFQDRAGHEDGLDEVILFDRSNGKVSAINYKTGILTRSISDNVLTFPIIDVYTYEGTTNIFAYDQSPPRMRKYRYSDLTALTFKDFPNVLFALKVYKQFIFLSTDDQSKSFQVLNAGNLNMVDSRTSTTGNRNLAIFEGDPLTVLEVSENTIRKYKIDATGHIVSSDLILDGITQLSTQNTTATSDTYFVAGRFGTMINRDGEKVGSLSSGVNSFIQLNRFSPDDQKVISIINDNATVLLKVNDITHLPLVTTLASYEIPSASYSDMIVDDHIIYVVGVTFATSQPQTFILKYPY